MAYDLCSAIAALIMTIVLLTQSLVANIGSESPFLSLVTSVLITILGSDGVIKPSPNLVYMPTSS